MFFTIGSSCHEVGHGRFNCIYPYFLKVCMYPLLTRRLNCQQHEKLQTRTIQRSVNKSSKSMCVNFVYKGLLYDFLLQIGPLLNVGHTAMEKPCPNWEGFKTIFCFFGQ